MNSFGSRGESHNIEMDSLPAKKLRQTLNAMKVRRSPRRHIAQLAPKPFVCHGPVLFPVCPALV